MSESSEEEMVPVKLLNARNLTVKRWRNKRKRKERLRKKERKREREKEKERFHKQFHDILHFLTYNASPNRRRAWDP